MSCYAANEPTHHKPVIFGTTTTLRTVRTGPRLGQQGSSLVGAWGRRCSPILHDERVDLGHHAAVVDSVHGDHGVEGVVVKLKWGVVDVQKRG